MKAHSPYNGRSRTSMKAARKPGMSKAEKKKKKRLKLLIKMFPMRSFTIFKFCSVVVPSKKRSA